MTPSKKYLAKLGLKDEDATVQQTTSDKNAEQENSRRNFLKKASCYRCVSRVVSNRKWLNRMKAIVGNWKL